ncbi:MAG: putative lactoylglutathione lyase [Parcubacteria group bacterium]|nr:putative lactoylglutathione lyase [Parcubacteria group bacterium]
MIDHVAIHVKDIDASKEFYAKALAPLGYAQTAEFPEWKVVGFGIEGKSDIWLEGGAADVPGHVAFVAQSTEQVQDFHGTALAAGGTDNGAPGYRTDYAPGYYAAFIHDLDGHNLEAVFHDPNPTI